VGVFRCPSNRILGGPQSRSALFFITENPLPLLGFDLRTVQPHKLATVPTTLPPASLPPKHGLLHNLTQTAATLYPLKFMVAKLVHAFTNNNTYKAGMQPGLRGANGCTAPTTNLQNIKDKHAEQPAKDVLHLVASTCYLWLETMKTHSRTLLYSSLPGHASAAQT
jgi:hypothetical protein